MVERCRDYGFDLLHSRVEVSPSAHYHMGGVKIDRDCRCNVEGLFVAGEDAGGVHGANRLGGNGVADSVVFGARAGDAMVEYVSHRPATIAPASQVRELCERWIRPLTRIDGANPFELRTRLEDVMWKKVGVVRNGDGLSAAVAELRELKQQTSDADGAGDVIYNAKWNEALNLANMTVVAEMIATSALLREESRGAHFRQDFPSQEPAWLKNICMVPDDRGLRTWTVPVEFTRLQPPESLRKPVRV
jgi:succinate dehydrogenase / fumarate reductase flavoprotein subunit/fumarate reductase flavoprotein subunit